MHNQIEYWLSSLKVVTIVIFIVIGILVNAGVNREHHYIGGENWRIAGAPFVGGFGGFARVFVTASFACECKMFFMSKAIAVTLHTNDSCDCVSCRWGNRESRYHGR